MDPDRSEPRRPRPRLLLLDVGNTHCHVAVATPRRLLRQADFPTRGVVRPGTVAGWDPWLAGDRPTAAVLCSVVPHATRRIVARLRAEHGLDPLVLTDRTLRGVGLDYPHPSTIGPDRLANAIAARRFFGTPSVVVDFGTAVTFDIVDARGCYVGGIIAPGLAAMTDYLHEKTALLPRIRIRDVVSPIGRSTEEAMLVGAVHGYRGLIRQLIAEVEQALRTRRLPVVATGGYARLLARGVPEITAVRPNLTLEGLRLFWLEHAADRETVAGGSRPRKHRSPA